MDANSELRKKIFTIFFILNGILFIGCGPKLAAVKDFSNSTISATNSFDTISEQLPDSCRRRVYFTNERINILNEVLATGEKDETIQDLETCELIEQSLTGIQDANNVLREYATALGLLSSDDLVNFQADLKTLEDNLKKVEMDGNKPFQERASAIVKITDTILSFGAKEYGRKKLREAIKSVKPDEFNTLVDGLIAVIHDYEKELQNEMDAIKDYQKLVLGTLATTVQNELNSTKKDSPVWISLFWVKSQIEQEEIKIQQEKINPILNKKQALVNTISILDELKSTYFQLYNKSLENDLDSGELIKLIQTYGKDVKDLVKEIQKAFD